MSSVNMVVQAVTLPDGQKAVMLVVEAPGGVGFTWCLPPSAVEPLCTELKNAKANAEGSIVLAPAGSIPNAKGN